MDLDGTLLDNNDFEISVTQYIIAEISTKRGVDLTEARRLWEKDLFETRPLPEWYSYDFHCLRLGVGGLARDAHEASVSKLSPLPDAVATVEVLARSGLRIAAVTDAEEWVARFKLEAVGLISYFEEIFSSAQFGAPKADPEYWSRLSAARGMVDPEDWVIDNRKQNLNAARRAGIAANLVYFEGAEHVTEISSELSPHIVKVGDSLFLHAISHTDLQELVLRNLQ